MADFDAVVLDAFETQVLSPEILEAALERAVELVTAEQKGTTTGRVDQELRRVEDELQRLTAALAAGGNLETLVKAIQEREDQRVALMAERERSERTARLTGPMLHAALMKRLEDWRGLLHQQVAQGQQLLRCLIDGKLTCRSELSRGVYVVEGTANLAKLSGNLVPLQMASPTGSTGKWSLPVRTETTPRHCRPNKALP